MANTKDNMKSYGVAWWKFDEESGNSIVDELGNYNGTAYNVTRVDGVNGGKALSFNGTNSYVVFNEHAVPIGEKSIRLKVKTQSITSSYIISTLNNPNLQYGIVFNIMSNGVLRVAQGDATNGDYVFDVRSSKIINDNQWHDILFTWDGTADEGGIRIFIDDMVVPDIIGKSKRVESRQSSFPTVIGRLAGYESGWFNGQLDEIEIYNDVISQIPDKTLIFNDGVYKFFNFETMKWESLNDNVTENDYIQFGIEDISVIPEEAWKALNGEVELSTYSDYEYKDSLVFSTNVDEYKLKDEFIDRVTILEYTEDEEQKESNVLTENKSFDLYDEFGDSMEVLYYTDDSEVTNPVIELDHKHSVIDELDGDFDVITFTNENESESPDYDENITVSRNVEFTGVPFSQFIVTKDVELYGYLKEFTATQYVEDKPNGIIRFLFSFDNEATWKTYKNKRWETVDISQEQNIIENGILIEELKNIPKESFEEAIPESGIFKVGYYIDENIRQTRSAKLDKVETVQEAVYFSPEIKDMSFYILNTKSTINVTLEATRLHGQLNDVDKGKVKYRVFLNSEPYFPSNGEFTELQPSPLTIDLNIDQSVIRIGQENSLVVEFQDYWGKTDFWSTTFIGTYYGLIFKDPSGEAYSTNGGDILKYLDIGTLIAGQVSNEFEIHLHNTHGYDVKNPVITSFTDAEGVEIELGKSLAPFLPSDKLIYEGEILKNGEKLIFYVRLKTNLYTPPVMGGTFQIRVNADKVDDIS